MLCYTQESAPRVHLACLLAGAVGVVHKDQPLDRLTEAIDAVAAGGFVVTPELASLITLLAIGCDADPVPPPVAAPAEAPAPKAKPGKKAKPPAPTGPDGMVP